MRIISGMRKGLKLKAPDGMNTRPTTDRVKESIFNLLQFHLPCTTVLDLFAGSGALGIEALSRYCDRAVFVDSNRQSADLVKENLTSARLMENASVFCMDALSFLDSCNETFDLIFLDPPYNRGFLQPIVDKIANRNLLNEDGVIVIESEKDGEVLTNTYYTVRRVATYGKTEITVLQR